MVKLSDLGFIERAVAETVVSTYKADGSPNAAPMGVTLLDERHLAITLYNSSTTLTNIKAKGCAVLNLTSDIEVYFRTAFKEANPNGILPTEWFTKAQGVSAPRLRLADAAVVVSVDDLAAADGERTRATFSVKRMEVTRSYPQVYCRAFGATVEAIIHATRVKALSSDPKQREHVDELLKEIQACNQLVVHVAPNSKYAAVMAELIKILKDCGHE